MDIIQMKLADLTMYEGNAKEHPDEQVDQICSSIEEFGMNDPIAVWGEDNIIVEGHGRYLACEKLGMEEVPVIRLDHLTDEQRRAYTIVHNQLTLNSDMDWDILEEELKNIVDIDMSVYDLELPGDELSPDEEDDDGYYGDERERTGNPYNLFDYDEDRAEGFYQIPIIEACDYVPDDLIGFNYVLSTDRRDCGVHFFLDDYQFERIWNAPQLYLPKLSEFQCVLTPDFSLYLDMPRAMKIWNVYRSRLIGQMLQDIGVKVIPTLQWAEKATYRFVFDGLRSGGTVAVSTVGVMRDPEALELWQNGMKEAMKRVKPKTILLYGTDNVDFDFEDVEVKFFESRKFVK